MHHFAGFSKIVRFYSVESSLHIFATKNEIFKTFHFKHRSETLQHEGESDQTSWCVIEVFDQNLESFLNFYLHRHWVSPDGKVLARKCQIHVFKDPVYSKTDLKSVKEIRLDRKSRPNENFSQQDLKELPELTPPRHYFPRGNVGTTDSEFRALISKCRLPTKVIKSLKLSLTRKKAYRRYQQLSHHYNDNVVRIPEKSQTVETKNGHEITPTNIPDEMIKQFLPKYEEPESNLDTNGSNVIEISDDEEDDFGMEGWEIHQSLNDDSSLARRNFKLTEENITAAAGTKERAFESEVELTWEKGGSGLVFYTDQERFQYYYNHTISDFKKFFV